jgi:hypothetical protein
MNEQVELLFRQLESPSTDTVIDSALALVFLLERTLWPGRYDSVHRLALPKELVDLRLDASSEVEDLIIRLRDTLASTKVPLDARISISSVLGKTGRAACIGAILSLLEKEGDSLSDEDVYSLIAAILPGFLASQPRALLQAAVEEYHTASVLQKLSSRESAELSDSLEGLQSSLSKLQASSCGTQPDAG